MGKIDWVGIALMLILVTSCTPVGGWIEAKATDSRRCREVRLIEKLVERPLGITVEQLLARERVIHDTPPHMGDL